MEEELEIKFNGKQVNKKYSKSRNHYTRVSFPKSLLRVIVDDSLFKRIKNSVVMIKYNLSEETLEEILFMYQVTGGTFNERVEDIPILGHKDVAYYSEKELLNLPVQYSWEELSETEKQFYLDYERS